MPSAMRGIAVAVGCSASPVFVSLGFSFSFTCDPPLALERQLIAKFLERQGQPAAAALVLLAVNHHHRNQVLELDVRTKVAADLIQDFRYFVHQLSRAAF